MEYSWSWAWLGGRKNTSSPDLSNAKLRYRASTGNDLTNWPLGDNVCTRRFENRKIVFKNYYNMPTPQTSFENCVAHIGSLHRALA